ncbi:MAG: NB-ARC domain-containing protein, partial [Chloroflexota bacterium]
MSDSQPQRGNVNISGGETNISGDLVGTKIVNLPPEPQPPSGSALPRRRPRKFVPRGKIMDDVRNALKVGSAAIVGMHGMGGVGKTELAKFLAGELKDEFKDGVLWIEVANRPIEIVQGEMARALGIKLPDGSDDRGRYAALCAALSGARALFVFDDVRKNFPLELCLPPAPCSALVTSRLHELLGVDKKFPLDVMNEAQALELLRGEGLTEVIAKEQEAAKVLCKACAYHPLALVLAASRLRLRGATPLTTFNNQLQDRIKQLRVDRDDKDASLEANFDLSYDELSAKSKERWRKLAVFAPSGFVLPAAQHLWNESAVDANEHLYELENASLVSPSLLQAERLNLHDLLRDYAFKKLN